mmetsp:Transcript_23364/g.47797  ORF Transcript_23364/g.47797 Transcript_23364/m.47797 type:complete len:238 (+) Transcript_23364:329-1042(+)
MDRNRLYVCAKLKVSGTENALQSTYGFRSTLKCALVLAEPSPWSSASRWAELSSSGLSKAFSSNACSCLVSMETSALLRVPQFLVSSSRNSSTTWCSSIPHTCPRRAACTTSSKSSCPSPFSSTWSKISSMRFLSSCAFFVPFHRLGVLVSATRCSRSTIPTNWPSWESPLGPGTVQGNALCLNSRSSRASWLTVISKGTQATFFTATCPAVKHSRGSWTWGTTWRYGNDFFAMSAW